MPLEEQLVYICTNVRFSPDECNYDKGWVYNNCVIFSSDFSEKKNLA